MTKSNTVTLAGYEISADAGNFQFSLKSDYSPQKGWDQSATGTAKDPGVGGTGFQLHEKAGQSVYLDDISVSGAKYGVSLMRTGESTISHLMFEDIESNDIYGAAIRLGQNEKQATVGITYVEDVVADGHDGPLKSYDAQNTDFLVSGVGNAAVYMRDITARNFADAIVDNKSVIYIMNATLEDSFRILRAHEGAKFVLVNCIINSGDGRALAWLADSNSKIEYYNTLWNGKTHPDAGLIESDSSHITRQVAASQVVELDHNPLPQLSSFFGDVVTNIVARQSSDGKHWGAVPLEGLTYGPHGLVGDINFGVSKLANNSFLVIEKTYGDGHVESTTMKVQGNGLVEASLEMKALGEHVAAPTITSLEAAMAGHDLAAYTKLAASSSKDNIAGQNGSDLLLGNQGDNTLRGNGGDDFLFGDGGRDTLNGGERNDILNGGSGSDELVGGRGADRFEMRVSEAGGDLIKDFRASEGDQLVVLLTREENASFHVRDLGQGRFELSTALETAIVTAQHATVADWSVELLN